ncbi:hypothetical protein A464_1635 [Salmonella bongori N268-08]|uniref:Uncharacterized protein n=1 Tax=Salmonella bongori N268-08 TaxID=1197719 RepID=S5N890_SALBN|nr:hypothetical protein A464_1635 [Salmonella bongori N268-08]
MTTTACYYASQAERLCLPFTDIILSLPGSVLPVTMAEAL